MPFLFTCPHCQAKTQVEDRYSGQSGECATCGNAIQIPQFASTAVQTQEKAKSNSSWIIGTGVALMLLGCLGFAVFQFGGKTVQRLSTNRAQNSSMRNVKKIAKALNAYAEEFGNYPPPALLDPQTGRPLLSWRVLILPYLGEEELFKKFDLTKDWSAQENMAQSYQMPAVFRHPGADDYYTPESDYFLITGGGTLFPPTGPMDPKKIGDSPSQTILVIEGEAPSVNNMWTEPIDLDFSKMTGQINGSSDHDPGKQLENGVVMATVDGRTHYLPNETTVITFNALATPSGGEPLADDTLD